jgi:hypothetical protein
MKWRTNLVRKTLPLPWLHPLRTAPFYLAKNKKPTPLRSTVRGTSLSAPPRHPRRLRRHRRPQTSLNLQCPSSTPPRRPCFLWRPRHPCRRAAPVIRAVPGQLVVSVVHTAAPPLLSAAPPSSVPPRRPRCPDRPRPASSPVEGRSDLRDGTGSSLRQEPGRPSLAVRISFDCFLVAFVDLVSLISSARGRQQVSLPRLNLTRTLFLEFLYMYMCYLMHLVVIAVSNSNMFYLI